MKIKKIGLLILSIFIVSSLIYYISKRKDITVYLGIANSKVDSINVFLSLDTLVLYNNYLHNNPWKYEIFELKLRPGIYPVVVTANDMKINKKAKLFIVFNQHIVVELYEKSEQLGGKSNFMIRNRLTPFYLE